MPTNKYKRFEIPLDRILLREETCAGSLPGADRIRSFELNEDVH
jgi:hypothetical protein